MVEVGDRVLVESEKVGSVTRSGVVTAVDGRLITVRWDAGSQSVFVLELPRFLRQDTSLERRMSAWKTDSQGTGASSLPSSKRDAVELVRSSGRPIAEIAGELGIYDSTLGNWVRQDRIDRGEQDGLTNDEQTRLRELERENARLRMERDLLKRTVAFWVKEQSTP